MIMNACNMYRRSPDDNVTVDQLIGMKWQSKTETESYKQRDLGVIIRVPIRVSESPQLRIERNENLSSKSVGSRKTEGRRL